MVVRDGHLTRDEKGMKEQAAQKWENNIQKLVVNLGIKGKGWEVGCGP